MRCKNCGTEWNAPQNISASLSSCPFCGASLTPAAPKQFHTVEDVLTEITSRFGMDVLKNGQKTMALFSDLSPTLLRERLLLSYLIQSEGNLQLLSVRDKEAIEQQACFQKVCRYLVDEQFVAQEAAYKICTSFSSVIGLRVQVEKAPASPPPSKASHPQASSAPAGKPNNAPKSVSAQKSAPPPAADYTPLIDTITKHMNKLNSTTGASKATKKEDPVQLLTQRAEGGDFAAQAKLAKWYRDGHMVQKNPQKAFYWYKKAAESNDPEALCNLGWCYIRGFGCTVNAVGATKYFEQAAKAGIPAAQYNLASCYERGHGIQKSLSHAAALYEQAAKANHTKAQYHLARCYKNGIGLAEDIDLAIHWYKKAAQGGHAEAQYQLGDFYENGTGMDQDKDIAYHWYKKAANQGHTAAKQKLSALTP